MVQRFEHTDFPPQLAIKTAGSAPVFGSLMGRELWFTALEDGLWIGTDADIYHEKIEWKNVGHVIRWMQTQNRKNR